MRISKIALWVSVVDGLFVLTASVSGIFLPAMYARETPAWALQGIGQDIINLGAVGVLVIAAYFGNKGSTKACLVWGGVLLYVLYAYSIYAFDIHFNSLFLMYVAILGLSFYTLVGSILHIQRDSLPASFTEAIPRRRVSAFLLVLSSVFALLWLREDIPALVTGTIPPSVTEANVPTNPVHILDFGFLLPAMFITALLLWQRNLLGYILAGPLLVFSSLMGSAILTIFLVMNSEGQPTSIGIDAFFGLIIGVSFVLSVLYIREVP